MIKEVIVIVGPTAVGKTKLGVELALKLDGEVISGDSMQIYREMNIGTAKVTAEETKGVIHHLIDIKNIDEDYSVLEFQKNVRQCIDDIFSRGKTPIIVGGTGLYIKAALYDYTFSDEKNKNEREDLFILSNEQLHQKLKEVDPKSAEEIHPNNRRRVLRALEIYEQSGERKSDILQRQEHICLYPAKFIGLTLPRDLLYERINLRVDLMIKQGLLDEFHHLLELGANQDYQSMKAIGYRELFSLKKDESNKEEIIESIKQHSRQYAKRQYTWFKNQMDIHWLEVDLKNFDKTIFQALDYVYYGQYYKKIAFPYHFEDLTDFKCEGILSLKYVYSNGQKVNPTLYELKTSKYGHQTFVVVEFDERKIDLLSLKDEYELFIGTKVELYSKKQWHMPGTLIDKMIEIRGI